jgi:hypothetical protein
MQPPGFPPPPPFGAPPPYGMPPQFPPPMTAPPTQTDTKATISLVLGIISLVGSFCYLGLPMGIPAVVLGFLAKRDIRKAGGMLGGGGLATGGIVTGFIGSALFLLQIGFFIFVMVAATTAASSPPAPYPTYTSPTPTATTPSTVPTSPPLAGGYGSIHVVDLKTSGGPLRAQLLAEQKKAPALGQKLLVETTATWCTACAEIERAMPDPDMQVALANVELVHVDVDAFKSELVALGMYQNSVPWFYLVDAKVKPVDAISADEWDDNEPENIAPVLSSFLDGKLTVRKHPLVPH